MIRAWEIIEGTVMPDVPDPRGPNAKGDNPAASALKQAGGTSEPLRAEYALGGVLAGFSP